MPVLAFDVAVKYAASITGITTCWKLHAAQRAHPVLRGYFMAFFGTLSLSLFIGATLIACNHGVDGVGAPALARTLLALTMAASGMCSLVAGATVHALRHASTVPGARLAVRLAVAVATLAFVGACAWLIIDPDADTATTWFALPGGFVLLCGALSAAARDNGVVRSASTLLAFGVLIIGVALMVSQYMLTPGSLPTWIDADGVYYAGLLLGIAHMAVGAVRLSLAVPAPVGARSNSDNNDIENRAADAQQDAQRALLANDESAWAPGRFPQALERVHGVVMWVMAGVGGGERQFRIKHAINLHKLLCPVVIMALMIARSDDRLVSWVYLCMHGTYGLTWLIKDQYFPDMSWETRATFGSFVTLFLSLALFWCAPVLLIGFQQPAPPNALVALALFLFILGFFWLHASDAQKYFTLRATGGGLITDGFFSRTRNPKYFGDLLIYSAFALMASRAGVNSGYPLWILPWFVNFTVWFTLCVPKWYKKDASLSRYDEFGRYAARTGIVLPFASGVAGEWWE